MINRLPAGTSPRRITRRRAPAGCGLTRGPRRESVDRVSAPTPGTSYLRIAYATTPASTSAINAPVNANLTRLRRNSRNPSGSTTPRRESTRSTPAARRPSAVSRSSSVSSSRRTAPSSRNRRSSRRSRSSRFATAMHASAMRMSEPAVARPRPGTDQVQPPARASLCVAAGGKNHAVSRRKGGAVSKKSLAIFSNQLSFALMRAPTAPMSARPAALDFTTPMTLPMSLTEVAPVEAMASAMSASSSVAESCCGR